MLAIAVHYSCILTLLLCIRKEVKKKMLVNPSNPGTVK